MACDNSLQINKTWMWRALSLKDIIPHACCAMPKCCVVAFSTE